MTAPGLAARGTAEITLNSDMGESIGIHSFGNDEALLTLVDTINVACGMHAGDPGSMKLIVQRALAAGVTVGAHPGLPDIVGFGRRAMALSADEVRDLVRYQVGALVAFLDAAGGVLHHIKPHGALFAMVSRDEELMDAVCDVAVQYQVPVFGLAGTFHESVARRRGLPFVSEFYVDLDYTDDGNIVVNRHSASTDLELVALRADRALQSGTAASVTGSSLPVRVDSFCIHSDLPNAAAVAETVRAALHRLVSPETR
ncbi:5-oxoprolinase subunit PxpA [Subtercola sp. YIM 133946]|uniref:5-oxoprolinase subunit PxpA n=1 Tax=Subtercola sp. YIM 133946 TaxID=3118909 RepID=UPI002F94F8D9